MSASVRFSFRIHVPVDPAEVRRWTIRSVTGDGGVPDAGGRLEVFDSGPDRFASRYTGDGVAQLRVVEWDGPESALGSVEVTARRQLRFAARFRLTVRPSQDGSEVEARYVLETPLWGLGLAFQFTRTRTLARRVARTWLRGSDERAWAGASVTRDETNDVP